MRLCVYMCAWPGKAVLEMTCIVSGGTLNANLLLTHSIWVATLVLILAKKVLFTLMISGRCWL